MDAIINTAQFLRYACKVYGLNRFLYGYRDSRVGAHIPASAILSTLIFGILTKAESILQMDRQGSHGLLGVPESRAPSKDTIHRFLANAQLDQLRSYGNQIVRTARYNKVFRQGTLQGWMVAAIDGTETFKTSCWRQNMEGWACRTVSGKDGSRQEFYERAVAANYVGVQPRLCVGVERIRQGEDEAAAALRLVRELDAFHGPGWFDVLVVDSYYARGPFLNEVLRGKRHVVVKVKQSNYNIVKDADALFENREPSVRVRDASCRLENEHQKGHGDRYDVTIWDEEEFVSWEQVNRPLRCLKVVEVRKQFKDGKWVEDGTRTYHVVTTLPRSLAKPELVWMMMHRRWDIENSLFNDWEKNWEFTHCYTHDTVGIEALYQLFAITRNLFLLFFYRNLRASTRRRATMKEWRKVFAVGLAALTMIEYGRWSSLRTKAG